MNGLMGTDQTFSVGRRNLKANGYGLKHKDENLHRLIRLKKMPSAEVLLARGLQLNSFSQKLQSLAEALVDNGELASAEGRAALRGVTEMMGTMNRHAVNTLIAYEQSEALRSGAIIHQADEIDVSDD